MKIHLYYVYWVGRYDELISDLPRKVKCVDDVLLWDQDIKTSFYRAWDYLAFCAENGVDRAYEWYLLLWLSYITYQ